MVDICCLHTKIQSNLVKIILEDIRDLTDNPDTFCCVKAVCEWCLLLLQIISQHIHLYSTKNNCKSVIYSISTDNKYLNNNINNK